MSLIYNWNAMIHPSVSDLDEEVFTISSINKSAQNIISSFNINSIKTNKSSGNKGSFKDKSKHQTALQPKQRHLSLPQVNSVSSSSDTR